MMSVEYNIVCDPIISRLFWSLKISVKLWVVIP
jgi:hypothetical protein